MKLKNLLAFAKKSHLDIFMKFSVSGIFMQGFNLAMTFVLTEVVGLYYFWSFIIAFTIITLMNFILHIKVIFKVQNDVSRRFWLYLGAVAAFYFSNIILVRVYVDLFGIYYLVGIALATITLYILKFLVYDNYVFKRGE